MNSKYSLPKDGGLIPDATPKDILCRYEKIPTRIYENESQGVEYIADMIESMIKEHTMHNQSQYSERLFSLGLTTGRTPVGLYRELVKRYNRGDISFKDVVVYSLDELYPIDPASQQSRNYRIREDFLNHIDIDESNIHIPDATVPQAGISEYIGKYEKNIKDIDLMLLGVGEEGQIGFNEPGTFVYAKARLVQLSHSTRNTLASVFHTITKVPDMAITMGPSTILKAKKIILMAWGEDKSDVIKKIVEGDVTSMVPASYLQDHTNIEVVVDENAAQQLTRQVAPWLVGPCEWTPKFIRRAVVWLCDIVNKPILKLEYNDYVENSLSQLLEFAGSYDQINIRVFDDLQHTITGWPGGKPDADDATRPVPSLPEKKRIVIFSPHPDDDVISMGGTFLRLVEQGHDVHVAYETSGSIAVHDDVVLQMVDTARKLGAGDKYEYVKNLIDSKVDGEPEPSDLLSIKAAIRRAEAVAACRLFGVNESTNVHFLNLPFYETGGIKKGELTQADTDIIIKLLREVKPHQIFAAGDLSDPHGTHRVCIEAVLNAIERMKDDEWLRDCHMWLYRGAWQEWSLGAVDMAVPLSPAEMIKKRHAIYRHLSQKDIVPFPGSDTREFWQRAEDRTQNTARLYDALGMAEYQAIEVFVKMF